MNLFEQNFSGDVAFLLQGLNLFQSKMKPAFKNAANPFFKSVYANYESVVEAIQPLLAETQLSYTHITTSNSVFTILSRSDGEKYGSLFCEIKIPGFTPDGKKNEMQVNASAQSYARRYGLLAIFGLPTGDDDDGESLSNHPEKIDWEKEIHNCNDPDILRSIYKSCPESLKKTCVEKGKRLKEEKEKQNCLSLIAQIHACQTIEEIEEIENKNQSVIFPDFWSELSVKYAKIIGKTE